MEMVGSSLDFGIKGPLLWVVFMLGFIVLCYGGDKNR